MRQNLDQPGIMDISANPFSYVQDASNAIFNPNGSGQPAGVGGPAKDLSKLVPAPGGQGFYDPSTGTSYTDASGQTAIKDPNVAQQIAQQVGVQNTDLANAAQGGQMLQQGYQGEAGLANSLNRTITDPNAPSVAGTQAVQGQENMAAGQMSAAAGQGGAGAGAARLNAMNNTAGMGADLNQTQALRRAQETASAQQNLGSVLNAQANQGAAYSAQNQGAAGQAAGHMMQGATGNQSAKIAGDQANTKTYDDLLNKGMSAAAGM